MLTPPRHAPLVTALSREERRHLLSRRGFPMAKIPLSEIGTPTISLTKEEARSGETSGHLRIILITSLTLAIISLAVLLFIALTNNFS